MSDLTKQCRGCRTNINLDAGDHCEACLEAGICDDCDKPANLCTCPPCGCRLDLGQSCKVCGCYECGGMFETENQMKSGLCAKCGR